MGSKVAPYPCSTYELDRTSLTYVILTDLGAATGRQKALMKPAKLHLTPLRFSANLCHNPGEEWK